MSIKETATSRSLLEEIAILSSRGESGRLQITAGATQGAFLFNRGKLVDARMGPFTGFSAINLAVSIGETRLSFDPSIRPSTSTFKEPRERNLLRDRFGIDTFDAEETGDQTKVSGAGKVIVEAIPQGALTEVTLPQRNPSAPPKDETEAIRKSNDSRLEFFSSVGPGQFLTQEAPLPSITKAQQPQKTLAAVSLPYRVRVNRSLTFNARAKFLLAGFILLIVISAAVGIASYWNKGKQTQALDASRPTISEPLLTPAPSQDAGKSIPAIKTVRAEPQRSTHNAAAPFKIEDDKTLPAEVRDGNAKEIPKVPSDDTAIEVKPSDKPSSRTFAVVVQIEGGHVTEAYIQNSQAGSEAFEETALHIARQRRYPIGTKRKETVIVQVTPR